MVEILMGSAATANSGGFSGSGATVERYRFTVIDDGSWTGTIKVAARLKDRGAYDAVSTYPIYLPITKVSDGSVIASGTGVTAAGIYEVDISGLEVRWEHTRSTGTVTIKGLPVIG